MPQGHAKKSVVRLANLGSRVAKPKKAKNNKITKKFTSGLVSKTEALLSERAGHMELIGKGKKVETVLKKGGSKKFG